MKHNDFYLLVFLLTLPNACSSGSFGGRTAINNSASDANTRTGMTNGYNSAGQGSKDANGLTVQNQTNSATATGGPNGLMTNYGSGFTTNLNTPIPPASEPMYAVTFTALYSIDPTNGASTFIGKFSLNGSQSNVSITDIAIDGKGQMFATDYMTLYAVNPLTAALSPVMNLSLGMVNSLTVLSNGSIAIGGDGVEVIDALTHNISTLVPSGQYTSSGDLIALPNKLLYWTVRPSQGTGNDQLLAIDPTSGKITVVGTAGVNNIYGLGYAYGNMYAFTAGGGIHAISNTTGQIASTLVNANFDTNWTGATTNPVRW